jgi:hypothetical protein
VASHGASVAEAEVDVVTAVHIGEVRATGGFYEDGKGTGPFVHPVHWDAAEERGLGAEVEFSGARMIYDETFFFALMEGVQAGAVHGDHGDPEKIAGTARIGKRGARRGKGL